MRCLESGKQMGEVINFQKWKDKKEDREIVESIGFTAPVEESNCPFCDAPTTVERTGTRSAIHTYSGEDVQVYYKLKALLARVVSYFIDKNDGVTEDDMVAAFGEGMRDFMKELQDGH
jgi:hypothetical protein